MRFKYSNKFRTDCLTLYKSFPLYQNVYLLCCFYCIISVIYKDNFITYYSVPDINFFEKLVDVNVNK